MIFECQFHAAFLFYHQGELGLVGCLQVDRAGLCRLITETTPACHIQIFAGFCRLSVLVQCFGIHQDHIGIADYRIVVAGIIVLIRNIHELADIAGFHPFVVFAVIVISEGHGEITAKVAFFISIVDVHFRDIITTCTTDCHHIRS